MILKKRKAGKTAYNYLRLNMIIGVYKILISGIQNLQESTRNRAAPDLSQAALLNRLFGFPETDFW